ncbi:MAG: hypothetical protein N4A45_03225 [Flavobacteriales bacterium]|jgi:hypothetical protein|nr:hypothetical protein [Flavobacteriales bacterium]
MLDINKLKELTPSIQNNAIVDVLDSTNINILNLSKNKIINKSLNLKSKGSDNVSSRVINNWIEKGVVQIDKNDSAKNNRFNKVESIWMEVLIELREYGLPLKIIKRVREVLFNIVINDFYLFKYCIIHSIIGDEKILMVQKDGYTKFESKVTYQKQLPNGSHIHIPFTQILAYCFPKNTLYFDYKIKDVYSDIEKLKLLFFLRTGSFIYMKIFVNDSDVRYIEEPSSLVKNKPLLKIIRNWEFSKIQIGIDDNTDTFIKGC